MDGKQARRTGTSSPLGMLIDHGCDAVTTFIFACGLGTIVGLGKINLINLCNYFDINRLRFVVRYNLDDDMRPILFKYLRGILYRRIKFTCFQWGL